MLLLFAAKADRFSSMSAILTVTSAVSFLKNRHRTQQGKEEGSYASHVTEEWWLEMHPSSPMAGPVLPQWSSK